MGYIYRITNTINGKQYIGQTTSNDINLRWNKHKKLVKSCLGQYIYNAYIKYGIDNFKFQIICICFDEDCNRFEEQYIQKYNTLYPNGYNLKVGGKNSKHHPESIEKMKVTHKLLITEEHREKMRKQFKGIPLSSDHRNKLSEKNKAYWRSMTTEQYKEICDKRKNNKRTIENKKSIYAASNALKKQVGQYDEYNNLIGSYSSIRDASNQTNICYSTISCVCRGKPKYKTAGGYIWKFIE